MRKSMENLNTIFELLDRVILDPNIILTEKLRGLGPFRDARFSSISFEDLLKMYVSVVKNPFTLSMLHQDQIWVGRGVELCSVVMRALIELRDASQINLNHITIRRSFSFDGIANLAEHQAISTESRSRLKQYLLELPGPYGSVMAKQRHGYVACYLMQFLIKNRDRALCRFAESINNQCTSNDSVRKLIEINEEFGFLLYSDLMSILVDCGIDRDLFLSSVSRETRGKFFSDDLGL